MGVVQTLPRDRCLSGPRVGPQRPAGGRTDGDQTLGGGRGRERGGDPPGDRERCGPSPRASWTLLGWTDLRDGAPGSGSSAPSFREVPPSTGAICRSTLTSRWATAPSCAARWAGSRSAASEAKQGVRSVGGVRWTSIGACCGAGVTGGRRPGASHAGGPEHVYRIGVVTGAAASLIPDAAGLRLGRSPDGEGSHHTFNDAMEYRINALYAGTMRRRHGEFKALGSHLELASVSPGSSSTHRPGL